MEDKLNEINKNLEKLETLFSSSMNKVNDRDDTIKQKDNRIANITDKMVEVTNERDTALKAKIELLESFTEERETTRKKILDLEKTVNQQKDKIKVLKETKRKAQDSIMGSTFEMDRIKKEVEERDKQIHEIEERVESVAKGTTGIFFDHQGIIDYLKERITVARRSLRLVVPTITYLDENNLLKLLNELPDNCIVNIATKIDEVEQAEFVEKWKERGFYLTNYEEENLVCISSNGEDVGVAFVTTESGSGFFTNILDLVTIFKQAVMHAFIRGKKIH
jgi:DNA repair exonuclease SbcCD ATPase subunit